MSAQKEAAQRLTNDETLQAAFSRARNAALAALATVDATDSTAVIRLQAEVAAIQRIRDALQEMILSAPRERKPVI